MILMYGRMDYIILQKNFFMNNVLSEWGKKYVRKL